VGICDFLRPLAIIPGCDKFSSSASDYRDQVQSFRRHNHDHAIGASVGIIVDRRGIARPDRMRTTERIQNIYSNCNKDRSLIPVFGPNCNIPPIEASADVESIIASQEFQSPSTSTNKRLSHESESPIQFQQNQLQQENIALLNDLGTFN
jgi:hypothetical protein